jgi:nicotinamidase-related amidase
MDIIASRPLSQCTVHLCVDMQRMFAEATPWHTPWTQKILGPVTEIIERHPEQTIFTRFIPPDNWRHRPGAWRDYFYKWQEMTLEHLPGDMLDILPAFRRFVPPAMIIDKNVYSPFSNPLLWKTLLLRKAENLIITGAETDICVLATVLGAIDRGYRVILPIDAICSASDETHDALVKLYRDRFSVQIETAHTADLLPYWTA